MAGSKKNTTLGKALIKTQKKSSSSKTADIPSSAGKHVSERDGGDAAVALASYLEGSSLDDFLANAVLANREFVAEKEKVVILDSGMATLPEQQQSEFYELPEMSFTELKVPRRPSWDSSTTPDELNRREKECFLQWRREIAILESASNDREVTPFEKNLEVWRQLWHVRERSDVMVQIVDARNPLFYRSEDLDAYSKEGDSKKRTLLIVNKSDFLTDPQRISWGNFFSSKSIKAVFFSARNAQAEIDQEYKASNRDVESVVECAELNKPDDVKPEYPVLSRGELLEYLSCLADEILGEVGLRTRDKGLIKFGMVGFPNVGKSSIINALLGAASYSHKTQRVAVGSTPGKTKHFQTLILSDKIMLCDCPGLVFPSFVSSKAEMYCCGVLPIAQLRDHVGACELICQRIPRIVFERKYGIRLPVPKTSTEKLPVQVYDLLEAFARSRGFTTTGKGGPDTSRAARSLLKDYVDGRLLYCHPPPNCSQSKEFDPHEVARNGDLAKLPQKMVTSTELNEIELDFDPAVPQKQVVSKRLKKHGRKGRKGRDKNPYEESDMSGNVAYIHVNEGGKKNHRKDTKVIR